MGYIYAEVLVTALVPESFFYQVPTRDISLIEFPKGGFAYRFFEHTEKDSDKVKTLQIRHQLKRNNCTAWTYFGKEYTLEEFKEVNWLKEREKEDILWQMETNNYTRIVNTICDGWFPLKPDDIAIEKQS